MADGARIIAAGVTSVLAWNAGDGKAVAASYGSIAITSGNFFKEGLGKKAARAITILGNAVGAYALFHDL